MQPLSRRTRHIYLALFVVLFIVLVPVAVLYSTGYRLGEDFTLVKMGGIYIGLSESGATLSLDGKVTKKAGILKNGFFVQDLTPRVYYVKVEKEGYRSWEKILEVKPQRVVEASAFILPNQIPYTEILPSNRNYSSIVDLFATSTVTTLTSDDYPKGLATSTRRGLGEVKQKGNIVLWDESGTVYARWLDNSSKAPSYFCEAGVCDKEIAISNGDTVDFFDFHPQSNELVLMIKGSVVYMTEIDPRVPRNVQTLFDAKGVQVRTEGDNIYIREPTSGGAKLFEYQPQ